MGHLSFHTGRVRADLVKSRFFTSRGFAAGGAPFVEHQSEASRAPLWGDEIDLGQAVRRFQERLVGRRQVTDAYLLGLALFKKGRLATLDESVMTLLPEGSPDRGSIEIIRGRR